MSLPPAEPKPIAVRAFVDAFPPQEPRERTLRKPSPWTLTFDTETTTDPSQQLRVGAYQIHNGGSLHEAGLFYDPLTLSDVERAVVVEYAAHHGLRVLPVEDWIEQVFWQVVDDLRGAVIAFNAPFDLSRIASRSSTTKSARLRNAFTFTIGGNERRPKMQSKHLTNRAAIHQLTVPARQVTPRGMRKRGMRVAPHRGYIIDIRTAAGTVLGGSWSLEGLTKALGTEHKKCADTNHGKPVTPEYLDYAVNDVLATWECYQHLALLYESYGLTETPLHTLFSEAGLGKAYLRQMGVRPWRQKQPDMPPELLGVIMSTYCGGRAEVHIRREISRVLYCDFLSMYPTVCTLMGLWRFVIAERVAWHDATNEVREWLDRVTVDTLQSQAFWPQLTTLVQIEPEADILPVRAHYDPKQRTIGVNHLTSGEPLWFTLADCIASRLLTGKAPKVLKALRFEPVGVQEGLRPICIAGNPEYRIDPYTDDFYRWLIELRHEVKRAYKEAKARGDDKEAARLDAEQLALKICANATSYGIFVELKVQSLGEEQAVTVYGPRGEGFGAWTSKVEEPGTYYHPLIATFITGAARLMLALTERLAEDRGLSWALCDTDGWALAKPGGMDEQVFLQAAHAVIDWFKPLNPYRCGGELLKIEDANYQIVKGQTTDLEPLYCFAVSAKRYALFNLNDKGRPLMRKVSAHGLGHLLAPYDDDTRVKGVPMPAVPLSDLGVRKWQHDVWYRIVTEAMGSTPMQPPLGDLPNFDLPAVSRYSAATPTLLGWFKRYNHGKPYRDRVKPYNFLLAYHAREREPGGAVVRPVSPYHHDLAEATRHCFDRETGEPVDGKRLLTYAQVLRHYHIKPEDKFLGGNYVDHGLTQRRHIHAERIEHIGKEADRWEEQFYLGADQDAQIEYGVAPEEVVQLRQDLLDACSQDVTAIAEAAQMSHGRLSRILKGQVKPTREMVKRLQAAVRRIQVERTEAQRDAEAVLRAIRERCAGMTVNQIAHQAGVHRPTLVAVLGGRRKPSRRLLDALEQFIVNGVDKQIG